MAFKMHCPKCGGLDFSIERDNRTFGAVAQAYELVFHCRCGKQLFGEVLLKEYEQQKKTWEEREEAGLDTATPDARVQRIEDRLRTGKRPLPGDDDDAFGRRFASTRRWQDDDADEDLEDDGGARSSAPAGRREKAASARGKARAKDGGKRKPAAAPVAKAKAAASRPTKKAALAAKARAAKPSARGRAKAVPPSRSPKRDTRRPASIRLRAAARTSSRVKPARAAGGSKAAARGRGHEEHGICIWPGCGKPTRANSKYCSRACSNKNARSRHKTRARKAMTKKSPRPSRSAKGR